MGGGFRISYEKEREEKTFVSLTLTHYYFMRVASRLNSFGTGKDGSNGEKRTSAHSLVCVGRKRESMDPCPRL